MRLIRPDGTSLWLTYCMNVHPGGTLASTRQAISDTVLPLRARLGLDASAPFALGLRFDGPTTAALAKDTDACRGFADELASQGLVPVTANAFVMGVFHGERVKERVYAPPWTDPARVDYTADTAEVLVRLSAGDGRSSVSSAPGSWRAWGAGPDVDAACAENVVAAARRLRDLETRTGRHVDLALEPEPGCTIQTVDEAIRFFQGPLADALGPDGDLLDHLGICYDVCHQAVVHEDVGEGLARLASAGVRVTKLQAASALEVSDPRDPEARASLAAFDEPVYLHQVGALDDDGTLHVAPDLANALEGGEAWARRRPWRVHFHVPVHREAVAGRLSTTRASLDEALAAVAGGGVTDHVEVETYTWGVLPEAERRAGLVAGLENELRYVASRLDSGEGRAAS